jgi:hypothetical protein
MIGSFKVVGMRQIGQALYLSFCLPPAIVARVGLLTMVKDRLPSQSSGGRTWSCFGILRNGIGENDRSCFNNPSRVRRLKKRPRETAQRRTRVPDNPKNSHGFLTIAKVCRLAVAQAHLGLLNKRSPCLCHPGARSSQPLIGRGRRQPSLIDLTTSVRDDSTPKLIVRIGLGRDTDAVSGFTKTPSVFSTRARKRMAVNCSGVDDRSCKSLSSESGFHWVCCVEIALCVVACFVSRCVWWSDWLLVRFVSVVVAAGSCDRSCLVRLLPNHSFARYHPRCSESSSASSWQTQIYLMRIPLRKGHSIQSIVQAG